MPELEEGYRFERYRILRRLGSSISGESYEAEDIVLQRTVALKRIRPGIILPEAARRQFFREMQGISELSHPRLAAILDYGEVEGQLYVARRLVAAGSLLSSEGRAWYRTPLMIKDAIDYTYQLAQALQYIHNYGYVHGGLSFSNVLVLREPQTENEQDTGPFLLADAGIAYFARRFGQLHTLPPAVTAPPEQRGGRVTPASDQYALASVLFFWLSGRPPFVGSPEEIEHLKLSESSPALSTLNPQVTVEQEAILRQALKVYPEERHASIIEFAEALLASLAQPVTVALAASPDATTLIAEQKTPAEPQPRPEGGPRPQAIPDIPQPPTEPAPVPPEPQPAPEPAPPEPEVRPQPAPDIIVPIPDPAPLPPEPPAKEAEPSEEEKTVRSARYVTTATFTITSPYGSTPREEKLERAVTTLGRAGSSDILLDYDTFTSRHHALVKRTGESYTIYDQHSAYGTIVNDKPLTSEEGHRLNEGDIVHIGVYELVFHLKVTPLKADLSGEHVVS